MPSVSINVWYKRHRTLYSSHASSHVSLPTALSLAFQSQPAAQVSGHSGICTFSLSPQLLAHEADDTIYFRNGPWSAAHPGVQGADSSWVLWSKGWQLWELLGFVWLVRFLWWRRWWWGLQKAPSQIKKDIFVPKSTESLSMYLRLVLLCSWHKGVHSKHNI